MASLGDILTARAIGIAWNTYQRDRAVAPFLGRSFFGTQKKDGLSLRWITGADGLPVALKGAAFDALAPLRDPIGFSSIEQEMPFFRESVVTFERDEQEYARFAEAGNDTYTAQILRQVMKNPMGLIDGATIVPERMIWQLIAPADGIPKITVTVDGGATYDIAYTADAGVAYKATNFSSNSGTSLWSAAATATPIADLIAMSKKNVTAHGKRITTFVMNATTWGYLMNAASTRDIVLGTVASQGGQLLFDNQVRQFILSNLGATVLVYDKVYANASGVATPFIPDGVVTGIAEGTSELGTVWFGTTPEERSGDASIGNLALVETGVAVYTYTTPHPINTHTVVSEIVLPSYENMNDVAVYKVA